MVTNPLPIGQLNSGNSSCIPLNTELSETVYLLAPDTTDTAGAIGQDT